MDKTEEHLLNSGKGRDTSKNKVLSVIKIRNTMIVNIIKGEQSKNNNLKMELNPTYSD